MSIFPWILNLFSLSTSFGALMVLGVLYTWTRKKGILYLFLALVCLTVNYGTGIAIFLMETGLANPVMDSTGLVLREINVTSLITTVFPVILIFLAPLVPQTLFNKKERLIWYALISMVAAGFLFPVIFAATSYFHPGWALAMAVIHLGSYVLSFLYSLTAPIRWRSQIPKWLAKPMIPVLAYFAFFHFPAMIAEDILMLTGILPAYNIVEATAVIGITTSVIVFTLLYLMKSPGTSDEMNLERLSQECGLTPREVEVFQMLVKGAPYKEIASGLNVSVDTVKTHASRVYKKTHTPGKQALRYFARDFR